ncbi:MAG: DNA polymerase III subunit delta [Candidatus Bipolaricaulota bacterium]|nr:DNA polymerase III subunit delta [Candidatus Bipolaricaulota bacterium]
MKPKRVFAFFGESFLRERAARKQIAELQKAQPSLALVTLDGSELDASGVREQVGGASLFASSKILFVRRADELPAPEALAELIPNGLAHNYLVLEAEKLDKRGKLYKALEKHAVVQELPKPDRRGLPKLVHELLQEQKLRVTPAGVKYLLASVEPEPGRLASEIQKLAVYAQGRELDVPELKELLFSDQSESVLQFLDGLGERRRQSLKELRALLRSGEDPNKIFFMIVSQVRSLLAIKSLAALGKSSDEIAKETGRFAWLVAKQKKLAQNFSEAELINLLHRLHAEDVRIKTGERTPEEALFEIVLAMTLSERPLFV